MLYILKFLLRRLKFGLRSECQTIVSSTFQSHFFQFGDMRGAADLGGRDCSLWIFFCQNRLIQVWKSMLKHRTHPDNYSLYCLKVDFNLRPCNVLYDKNSAHNKAKRKKSQDSEIYLFFQLRLCFICISCYRRLKISPRPCNLLQPLQNLMI